MSNKLKIRIMKTTVNNIASENVTSFVINEDMLNEKKAMKYISKPNMVAAINDICDAIKVLTVCSHLRSTPKPTARKNCSTLITVSTSSILTSATLLLRLVTVKKKRENVKNVVVRLKSKRIPRNLSSQPSR